MRGSNLKALSFPKRETKQELTYSSYKHIDKEETNKLIGNVSYSFTTHFFEQFGDINLKTFTVWDPKDPFENYQKPTVLASYHHDIKTISFSPRITDLAIKTSLGEANEEEAYSFLQTLTHELFHAHTDSHAHTGEPDKFKDRPNTEYGTIEHMLDEGIVELLSRYHTHRLLKQKGIEFDTNALKEKDSFWKELYSGDGAYPYQTKIACALGLILNQELDEEKIEKLQEPLGMEDLLSERSAQFLLHILRTGPSSTFKNHIKNNFFLFGKYNKADKLLEDMQQICYNDDYRWRWSKNKLGQRKWAKPEKDFGKDLATIIEPFQKEKMNYTF